MEYITVVAAGRVIRVGGGKESRVREEKGVCGGGREQRRESGKKDAPNFFFFLFGSIQTTQTGLLNFQA